MKKSFFDINEVGKVYLWCLIMPQLLAFVASLILGGVASSTGQDVKDILNITPVYIAFLMLSQVAFFIVFLMFTRTTKLKPALKLNTKFGVTNTIICVLIGIIGLVGFSPFSSIFSGILDFLGYPIRTEFYFDLSSPLILIISIILIAGVPAIVEELIFRGIILQGLKKLGTVKAILITSALFALVHLSIEQLVFPFIFSCILCYVVLKTNSILASILIHFTSNALSILMYYFNISLTINLPFWAFALVGIAIACIAFGIIYLLSKRLKNVEEKSTEKVIQFIDTNENQVANYNSSTRYLKIAVAVGVTFWVINFITAIYSI